MPLVLTEYECSNCGSMIAAVRWADLCPICDRIDPVNHRSGCQCEACAFDGDDEGPIDGMLTSKGE